MQEQERIINASDELEKIAAAQSGEAYVDEESLQSPWKGEPLKFLEFVYHADHMAFPQLSEKQIELCKAVIPEDPKETFNPEVRLNDILVALCGKGSLLGNSEIITADGQRMTIEESFAQNKPLLLFSKAKNGEVVSSLSTAGVKKDQQENCFRLQTSFGHVSEASEDHLYFTPRGWKKLKELSAGDWICAAQTIPIQQVYDEDEKLCRWAGYALGDGCLSRGRSIQFFASKPDIISDYVSLVENFGGVAKVLPHNTPISKVITTSFSGKGHGPLYIHAKRLGIYGKLAGVKRIPTQIMFSSVKSRKSFLEALFATDGWVRKSEHASWEIGYCSKSRGLVDDIDFMLRSFGIAGRIRPKYTIYRGKKRESWVLTIGHKAMQRKFSSLLRVPGKTAAQEKMDLSLPLNKVKQKGWVHPPEFSNLYQQESIVGDDRNIRHRVKVGAALSYESASHVSGMAALVNNSIIWEKITSITPLGLHDVYTFTVANTHNYLQGGLFHHNSGKDAIACLLVCYLVYILLHLRDAFHFVYGAKVAGEPIDIVIVAPRGRTSEKVTFEKMKQRVLHWKWLRKQYTINHSGRAIHGEDRDSDSSNTVEVGAGTIIFPGNIRVFALNSSNESAEGFNILAFICTEFAAFVNSDDRPNADKIYNTLYTSANTRFHGKFLGMLISYPRYKGDAIMVKYAEAQETPRMFGMKAASWEFNPMLKKEHYLADLNSPDPEKRRDAETKYLCNPGEKESRFIADFARIKLCVQKRLPVVNLEDFEETLNNIQMIRKRIVSLNVPRQPDAIRYVARMDLGETQDRASLCLAHLEGEVVVVDLLAHWIPDPTRKLIVDVDDPARLAIALRQRVCNLSYVTFDRWSSSSSINRLNRRHISSAKLSLGAGEYQLFLNHLYSGQLRLLEFPALTDENRGELAHLVINRMTGKVDHELGWHNDLTEAVCGVVAMLKGMKKNISDVNDCSSNIKPNLTSITNNLWSEDIGEMKEESEDGIHMNGDDDSDFPGDGISIQLR